MFAKNSLLARLAASARSRAFTSSVVREATFCSSCSRLRVSAASRDSISESIVLNVSMSSPRSSSARFSARTV